MKFLKKIETFFVVICFFLCISFLFSCASKHTAMSVSINNGNSKQTSEEIMKFATEQLDSIFNKIPKGMESQFGFQSLEDMENATIGNPIGMYYWKENDIIESPIYRVPILVDGKMVSLLTVSTEEQLTVGDFGSNQLAQTVQKIADMYNINPLGILRVYSISSDFLMFKNSEGDFQFIPMSKPTVEKFFLNTEDLRLIIAN